MSNELLYLIALNKIPKIGPITSRLLISYCGGAQAVFESKPSALMKIPHIGVKLAYHIKKSDPESLAHPEMAFAEKNNIQIISYLNPKYPQRLLNFEASPSLLYFKGSADLNASRMVAFVGTRNASEYGKMMCEKIVNELALYDPIIVSGLAYGIDTIAHKCALKAGLQTVGILGHGLDRMYPSQNKSLAKAMIEQGGLLTEFPSNTKPDREHFPMRNRIIAALSDVVVVIESAKKGGSIITAEIANQYNKDVFAVPGKITDTCSEGCNNLIKQHKAHLIQSAADISYITRWEDDEAKQGKLFVDLNQAEQDIYDFIKTQGSASVDQIFQATNKTLSECSSTLLALEFKSVVKSLPGKRYVIL